MRGTASEIPYPKRSACSTISALRTSSTVWSEAKRLRLCRGLRLPGTAIFGAVRCALVPDVLSSLVVHPGFYASYHVTLRPLEAELLVEGVGLVIVYVRSETELLTPLTAEAVGV